MQALAFVSSIACRGAPGSRPSIAASNARTSPGDLSSRSVFQRFWALSFGFLSAASFKVGNRRGRVVVRGRNFEKNIKKQKGPAEARKARITARHLRQIVMAMKSGGADPSANALLARSIKAAINDNVQRAPIDARIKSFTEGKDATEEITMSGHSQGGAGVIVELLTDNPNRTRSEIKDIFKKAGGEIGSAGCVDHNFSNIGIVRFDSADEEKVLEASLAADVDVEDITTLDDGIVEVITTPETCNDVAAAFESAGLEVASSEVVMRPTIEANLNRESTYMLLSLLHTLSDNDDVGEYYHNANLDESIELKFNPYGLPENWKNAYGK